MCKNVIIDNYEVICADNGEVLGYEYMGYESGGRIEYTYMDSKNVKNQRILDKYLEFLKRNYGGRYRVKRIAMMVGSGLGLSKPTMAKLIELSYKYYNSKRGFKTHYPVLMAVVELLGIEAGLKAVNMLGLKPKILNKVLKKYDRLQYVLWDPSVYVKKYFTEGVGRGCGAVDDPVIRDLLIEKSLKVFEMVKDVGIRHGMTEKSILRAVCEAVERAYFKKRVPKRLLKFYNILGLEKVLNVA